MALLGLAGGPMRWLVGLASTRYPRVLFSGPDDRRRIALTIDDSPDATTTAAILDVLRRHRANATFFIITDRVQGIEPLLDRIVAEGHELANHLTRDQPSTALDPEEFERELARSHEILSRHTDELTWFRPGAGRFTERILDAVEALGYRCALGSVYPLDPYIPSSRFAAWVLLAQGVAGSVVILHDGGGRGTRTVATLSKVLPEWREQGFEVVTLSELVEGPTAAPSAPHERRPT